MSKIIKSNINNEIKSKLINIIHDSELLSEEFINNCSENNNIHYIQSDDKLMAFCIYSKIDRELLMSELNLTCSHFDDEAMNYYKELILNMSEDTIYIDILESMKKGCGYGKELVESIIELNKDIILYSSGEAETFWEKNDFINIFGFEYMYSAND